MLHKRQLIKTKDPFGTAEHLPATLLQDRNQAGSSDKTSLWKKENKFPPLSAEVMVCPTVNVGRSVLGTDKKGWSFRKKEKVCL